jgi:filamentous hemagglutinin family protein
MANCQIWVWRLGLGGFLAISGAIPSRIVSLNPGNNLRASWDSRATAQITPDATLGAERSVVTPNANVGGLSADQIDGGAVRGINLFHSFLDFNVGEGQRVYFANPAGIENILTRVTGTAGSNILGTLGVDGGASLFLLNPNGIVFGPKAQLDIAGSFVASTANRLVFENGWEFSATNPEAPPLLTINLRPGLQYGTNQLGAISNSGNLVVGQNLTLVSGILDLQGQLQAGGNLTLQASDTVRVQDTATNPFIASAGGQLLVQGDAGGGSRSDHRGVEIFALNHPESGFFSGGDMVLRSANTIEGDAHYTALGNFRIEQLDGSLGNWVSPFDPVIRASGDVSFTSYTGASLHVLAGGSVNIGSVTITGTDTTNSLNQSVTLSDGTSLTINGSARPTLDIRAGTTDFRCTPTCGLIGTPSPTGLSFLTTPTSADITIREIAVSTPDGLVLLTNQYSPNTTLPGGTIQIEGINTTSSSGNGGDVAIDSRGGIALTGNINSQSNAASGNGGKVTLVANGDIATRNINASSDFWDGGQITLTSRQGAIDTSAGSLFSFADSPGRNGGAISLTACCAGVLSATNADITTGNINSKGGALGGGGNITLTSNGRVSSANSLIQSNTFGSGQGGDINITAGSVSFTNGVQLVANTRAEGNAGNVNISSSSLSVTNGAQLSASTFGRGNAGNVNITAADTVSFDGADNNGPSAAFSRVEELAEGNGGNLTINTRSLSVTNGALLSANTRGRGDAGNVNITAADTVSFDGASSNREPSGAFSSVEALAVGNGGNLTINTRSLSVINGAQLNANTRGQGNAGNANITADTVSIDGVGSNGFSSRVASRVEPEAVGNGGNLTINTRSLSVTNGAFLSVNTRGQGDAGRVNITATDTVSFDGVGSNEQSSAVFSQVNPEGVGNGGNLTITTGSLSVTNGAQLVANTSGQGDAGRVNITETDTVSFDGVGKNGKASGAFSSVASGAEGNGGNLTITTGSLSVTNGALLVGSTRGQGNAGRIVVRATDSISLARSGIYSTVVEGAVGQGGNIDITTGSLSLNKAAISSDSAGTGRAGDIRVTADFIGLDRSRLVAETASGQGGNINLQVRELLLLRDRARISTTAGNAQTGGDGGNITIDTRFIVAVPKENSNITANAYEGNGGRVTITAQGIFGIEFRERLTRRSDITASSELGVNGVVEISRLDVDPSRGLTALPTDLVDPSRLIDHRCQLAGGSASSKFTIAGRGGLLPNPNDFLGEEGFLEDLGTPVGPRDGERREKPAVPTSPRSVVPNQIVEAQGWTTDPEGNVMLTAQAPTATPQHPWQTPDACKTVSNSTDDGLAASPR